MLFKKQTTNPEHRQPNGQLAKFDFKLNFKQVLSASGQNNCLTKNSSSLVWSTVCILCLMYFGLLIAGCNRSTPAPEQIVLSVQGETMGTTYTVKWTHAVDGNEETNTKVIKKAVDSRLEQINDAMSTYRENSEISRFNATKTGIRFKVSKDFYDTLTIAQAVSKRTDGAFDITVAPLVNAWGFGPDGRVTKRPSEQIISLAQASIGYNKLQLVKNKPLIIKKAPLNIDLSAVAKGYGVDAVANMLEQKGIGNYFVEIGGEAFAQGYKPNVEPWIVAVEKPDSGTVAIQEAAKLGGLAIATSGDYRNYFEENGIRYSHTIDPISGYPITHKLASVSVLRSTCAEADALATALMVMGDEKGVKFAKDKSIAALFLVKSDDGFEEILTGDFASHLVNLTKKAAS